MHDRTNRRRASRGFTLIELSIVIAIIGILVYFVLAAGAEGVRNAEIRATQSLITKLNVALSERMDALLTTRVIVNDTHNYVGGIPNPSFGLSPNDPPLLLSSRRGETIARIEMFRSEVPDVWFPQNDPNYPVNCAGQAYPWLPSIGGISNPLPGTSARASATIYDPFVLPMGAAVLDNPLGTTPSFGASVPLPGNNIPTETGIFGASHAARAGLLKNLGYLAKGFDGVDSDGNGLIDDLGEGDDGTGTIQANLANHKHVTARSEMLYALLVEGRGLLGSVFTRDDFTSKEVQDTDGDGLPEFVDAWGQPLQFYLWPVYYHSDSQKGNAITYAGILETRERASLDPQLELVAPSWWANIQGTDTTAPSYRSLLFGARFFTLFEVNNLVVASPPVGTLWDRQNIYPRRREYYNKFLIVSSGPDLTLGLLINNDQAIRGNSATQVTTLLLGDFSTAPFNSSPPNNAPLPGESWAVQTSFPNTAGEDDLSNHKIDLPGGGATP